MLRTRILLGAISLDLFAVLFGGAVALLPVYARDILHVGPVGLGVLRAAPAVGALSAAVLLARRPLQRPAGPTLMVCVAGFGAATVVWGASRWLPVTLVFLAVIGFVDMFSVNIRSSTVALVTPNELRGRVTAVEMVFISASNELGAFESGAVAKLLGTVTSVVVGGALTIGIAGVWTRSSRRSRDGPLGLAGVSASYAVGVASARRLSRAQRPRADEERVAVRVT